MCSVFFLVPKSSAPLGALAGALAEYLEQLAISAAGSLVPAGPVKVRYVAWRAAAAERPVQRGQSGSSYAMCSVAHSFRGVEEFIELSRGGCGVRNCALEWFFRVGMANLGAIGTYPLSYAHPPLARTR